ncbi:MAG TPA: Flp pilus assembly protein CpaB [Solirubrobacteraceae bacterium]|nr:Flp pilus assembly protein CpaB [Solirubrobacteraceae bacterium]
MELTRKSYGSGGFRKLLSTRHGTALIAVACTIVAAGILLFAASRYRHSVNAQGQPVTVLVATSVIQKGTPGSVISSGGMFRSEQIVAKQASSGAIADAAALQGKVAASDINPGQELTVSDFSGGTGYVSDLAPDQRAISIPLDASHGLNGVVKAGDRVDVYAGLSTTVGGNSTGVSLRLLDANIAVLAVGENASGTGVGSGSGVTTESDIILKVNASQAGALAFASDNGKVWLILRGANAVEPQHQQQELYTINSLLLGSRPAITGGKR